jgi:hypothetical protein
MEVLKNQDIDLFVLLGFVLPKSASPPYLRRKRREASRPSHSN